jgi:DNA-directed RNA polymerase subunit RPC12/RpoP
MFARVMCPACNYQFSIPEGDMGKRHVCPNCRSPFIAGKSVAEPALAVQQQAAFQQGGSQQQVGTQPGFAKTMLGEMAPPIKYNCPRCKAALEAPASEAGTKKPCPACGQRLQVPAAPPPPAPAPRLDKTMLASDESAAPPIKYNCPNCKKPLESPASEAGMKKNCPACSQRLQVPAAPIPAGAPNLNKTMLAGDESRQAAGIQAGYPPAAAGATSGAPAPAAATPFSARNVAIAAAVVAVLLLVVPAVIRGGKSEDAAALAKAKEELEKLKADIAKREQDTKREELNETKRRRDLAEMAAKFQADLQRMREDQRETLRAITDAKLKKELEDKFTAAQLKWEQEKADRERDQRKLLEDAKAKLDESKRALEASQQRQQTIIHQPPPVMYYPPYHWRYYWPW